MRPTLRSALIAAGILTFSTLPLANAAPQAPARSGWQRDPINLRAGNGRQIRAIHHPPREAPTTRIRRQAMPAPRVRHRAIPLAHNERLGQMRERIRAVRPNPSATATPTAGTSTSTGTSSPFIHVLVIDSPPIDGFVPYLSVVATDEGGATLELDAIPSTDVGGSAIQPDDMESAYAIGLFDTGAGAMVMGNAAGIELGLFANGLLTTNTVTITGVTGAVDARVSYPIGVYVDGIDAIDPNSLLLDTTAMLGETNVSIGVGQTPPPGAPDLPTAIGMPLAVFYSVAFDNEQTVTRTIDSEIYETPLIEFFEKDDPQIPEYPNFAPLELRPLGGVSVQYIPCIDFLGGCDFDAPQSPSIIIGNSAQSLYFLGSVDCYNNDDSAIDRNRFMFDTGAQVTVIGNRVAARLRLNPNNPDFEVEIEGVTGEISIEPGFIIDRIDIPALGEWLTYTDVPVVLLDVASPEGGTLDGIIGMNLFNEFNFVLRGGGLFLEPDPSLEFQLVATPAVDADADNDGDVDLIDFAAFQRCATDPDTPQNNPACAFALLDADDDVDAADLELFHDCLSGPELPADPTCTD